IVAAEVHAGVQPAGLLDPRGVGHARVVADALGARLRGGGLLVQGVARSAGPEVVAAAEGGVIPAVVGTFRVIVAAVDAVGGNDVALHERRAVVGRNLVHAAPRLVLADVDGAARQQAVGDPDVLEAGIGDVVVDVVFVAVQVAGQRNEHTAELEIAAGIAGGAGADLLIVVVRHVHQAVEMNAAAEAGIKIAVTRLDLDAARGGGIIRVRSTHARTNEHGQGAVTKQFVHLHLPSQWLNDLHDRRESPGRLYCRYPEPRKTSSVLRAGARKCNGQTPTPPAL